MRTDENSISCTLSSVGKVTLSVVARMVIVLSMLVGCGSGRSAPLSIAHKGEAKECTSRVESGVQPPLFSQPEFTLSLADGVRMRFVRVPTFAEHHSMLMDMPVAGATLVDNSHTVPFFISYDEVTVGQWNAVMGEGGQCEGVAHGSVRGVSWQQCHAFCQKLSEQTGEVFSLPTVKERLYASRVCESLSHKGVTLGQVWFGDAFAARARFTDSRCSNTNQLGEASGETLEWCTAKADDVRTGTELSDADRPVFFPRPVLYGQDAPVLSAEQAPTGKERSIPFMPTDTVSNATCRVVCGGDVIGRGIVTEVVPLCTRELLFIPSSLRVSHALVHMSLDLRQSQLSRRLPTGVRIGLSAWDEEKGTATITLSTLEEPLKGRVGEFVGPGKAIYIDDVSEHGVRLVVMWCEWLTEGSSGPSSTSGENNHAAR